MLEDMENEEREYLKSKVWIEMRQKIVCIRHTRKRRYQNGISYIGNQQDEEQK